MEDRTRQVIFGTFIRAWRAVAVPVGILGVAAAAMLLYQGHTVREAVLTSVALCLAMMLAPTIGAAIGVCIRLFAGR